MKITITNEQDLLEINSAKIKEALKLLPTKDKLRLSLVFLNDEEIAKINERYLKHEGPTDVITFPTGHNEGEILISTETALREAKEREVEVEGEIILYIIHGALHLLGYDDKSSEEEFKEMHRIERGIIQEMGYKWDWDGDLD